MRSIATVLSILLATTLAAQDAGRVLPEYDNPGVVVLALGSEQRTDTLTRLLGGDDPRPLIKMQAEIAMKASRKNPVVILAPDDETKLRFVEDCDDYEGLCTALDSGDISVHVVPHTTAWVRDYGPMFRQSAKSVVMIDAAYHDRRADESKREMLAQINQQRLEIVLRRMSGSMFSGLGKSLGEEPSQKLLPRDEPTEEPEAETAPAPEVTTEDPAPTDPAPEAETAPESAAEESAKADENETTDVDPLEAYLASEEAKGAGDEEEISDEEMQKMFAALGLNETEDHTDEQLHTLADLYETLERYDEQRVQDDAAPAGIVLSLFSDADVASVRPEIDLDGGNLLAMADGRCITTRGLIERNVGSKTGAREILEKTYGCTDVIYLEALPGGVIEHVDMFVLPGGDKRVFVASYDPSHPILKKYWAELSGSMKRVVVEAAVVMANNARILRSKGYEVIEVPSPLPRIGANGPYYPTILNGLVQRGIDQQMQFLLPRYEGYETDVQDKAFELIRTTLGAGVEVDTIESTAAATAQGAVHCLTLVVPQKWTYYGDADYQKMRRRIAQVVSQMDKTTVAGQAGALEGTWHFSDLDGEESFYELEPTVVFRQQKIRFKIGESTQASEKYEVVSKNGTEWTLKLGDGSTARIGWKDPNSIEFMGEKSEMKLALVRK